MSLALPGCPISSGLRSLLTAAGQQSQANYPRSAGTLLNRAADWFSNNIRVLPVRALLSLLRCHSVVQLYAPHHTELFSKFYQHMIGLTREIYGAQHIITRLICYLLALRTQPTQCSAENLPRHPHAGSRQARKQPLE